MRKTKQTVVPVPQLPPTREVYFDNIVSHTINDAAYTAVSSKEECSKWAENFKTNPVRALEWSSNVAQSAATWQVNKHVLDVYYHMLAKGDPYSAPSQEQILRVIHREVKDIVSRKSRFPERSTSPISNEASLCVMSAYAEMLEKLERRLERFS
jgi:hypothetical protein